METVTRWCGIAVLGFVVGCGSPGPSPQDSPPDGTPESVTALTREWAGATFSQDGEWLFLNLYSPGVTVAITGPWQDGYI